jgi:hypothetical protein
MIGIDARDSNARFLDVSQCRLLARYEHLRSATKPDVRPLRSTARSLIDQREPLPTRIP